MTRGLSDDLLQVFEASVDAMLIADAQGRIRRINPALRHLFGLPPEAAGLEVNDLVPESLRAAHARQMSAYRQAPKSRPMGACGPLRARRADGSEFPAEVSLSPLPDGRVLATVHDISARVAAQASAQQWSERYACLLGAIPDLVVEVDGAGRLGWGNAAAQRFFGDDLAGQALAGFHDARPPAADVDPVDGEHWFRRTDGELRLLSWHCSALDDAGTRICSARDVTERHRSVEIERNLRAQMRQMHGLQVAGQTVRMIAHDLNQPLNAVSAYATAALRLIDEQGDPARLRAALHGCCDEVDRAGEVMATLMNFLARDALQPEPINLDRAVRNVVRLCEADGDRNTRFEIDVAPDLWQAMGNQRQFESVLHSLITNSVEALRHSGVSAPSIRIEARNDPTHPAVQVTLSDNGPGLDEHTATQAFAPFFTTKLRAVGLGLTISRALIEAGGGELWYDGDAAPGATFRFTVPARP
ncbi:PAS domain S-box protein [Nitrogeniibacter mangrovi]|uniref:histidine kinase n=1 Tax=Nitrogeniibacter mangrovi TaxID=2016596 RepID=A0A6C1B3P0_9RHOO|nr:PAS domain S-box protein [Nitrogeniibacter mangrovi]QID16814.1 PAS domain S-box protein [Nitrogeniibacter mangrovi]